MRRNQFFPEVRFLDFEYTMADCQFPMALWPTPA
jgi:hypothetical protein